MILGCWHRKGYMSSPCVGYSGSVGLTSRHHSWQVHDQGLTLAALGLAGVYRPLLPSTCCDVGNKGD